MKNEDQKATMTDPKQTDWSHDEAVVRAAVPSGVRCIYSDARGRYLVMAEGMGCEYGSGMSKSEAWKKARQHPTVQAFERQHNPQHAAPSVSGEGQQEEVWPDWLKFPCPTCKASVNKMCEHPDFGNASCMERVLLVAATPPPALPLRTGFMRVVPGSSRCIRCEWVVPQGLSYDDENAALHKHLDTAHPGWQSDGIKAALPESGEMPSRPKWGERPFGEGTGIVEFGSATLVYMRDYINLERQLLVALQRVEREYTLVEQIKAQRDAAQSRIAHLESEIARVGVEFDGSGVLLNIRADALEAERDEARKALWIIHGGIQTRQYTGIEDWRNIPLDALGAFNMMQLRAETAESELSAIRQQRGKGFEAWWANFQKDRSVSMWTNDSDVINGKSSAWAAWLASGAQEWIPVERELPEERIRVIGWDGFIKHDCFYGHWNADDKKCWRMSEGGSPVREPIEAWTPFPAPPAPRGSDQNA